MQFWSSELTIKKFQWGLTSTNALTLKMCEMTKGKHFVETEHGYIGWAPIGTEIGDVVCVLLGSNVPLILRPATEPDDGNWLVVGPAYVHGLMYGEAIYQNRYSQQFSSASTKDPDRDTTDSLGEDYQDANEATAVPASVILLKQAGIDVEHYERYKLVV